MSTPKTSTKPSPKKKANGNTKMSEIAIALGILIVFYGIIYASVSKYKGYSFKLDAKVERTEKQRIVREREKKTERAIDSQQKAIKTKQDLLESEIRRLTEDVNRAESKIEAAKKN